MSTCQDHHHCQHQALTMAEEICAERGLRLTPQRRQVLTLIWQSHRPMKAYDLLEQMQQDDPSAKPPTVSSLRFLDGTRADPPLG